MAYRDVIKAVLAGDVGYGIILDARFFVGCGDGRSRDSSSATIGDGSNDDAIAGLAEERKW